MKLRYGSLVPNERRAAMMDAAMSTIVERDVASTSMDSIAERVGVSRVTLYREFGNRKSLLENAIAYRLMKFDNRFFMKTTLTMPLAELVREYLLASVRTSTDHGDAHRWTRGGMSSLRVKSPVQMVTAATWAPVVVHYQAAFDGLAQSDAVAFGSWINMLQYSLSRLAIEACVDIDAIRATINVFVCPAFSSGCHQLFPRG